MGKPRKIDARVLLRLDAATIARTTSEEYSHAAAMADVCAESAKSNPSRNAFEALAALARREANAPTSDYEIIEPIDIGGSPA